MNDFLKKLLQAYVQGDDLKAIVKEAATDPAVRDALVEEHRVKIILRDEISYKEEQWLGFQGGRCAFQNLTQGNYSLELESGQILWQQSLDSSHLILAEDEPLQLAADTGEAETSHITHRETLLDGGLQLSIQAGTQSGTLHLSSP